MFYTVLYCGECGEINLKKNLKNLDAFNRLKRSSQDDFRSKSEDMLNGFIEKGHSESSLNSAMPTVNGRYGADRKQLFQKK